jgi:hypothetical protein
MQPRAAQKKRGTDLSPVPSQLRDRLTVELLTLYPCIMRSVPILLLCLVTGAWSDARASDVGPPPDPAQLKVGIIGIMQGINDSKFSKPIEVVGAPPSSVEPWMVCIRSATSDEAKRVSYSVFYGRNYSSGKDGQYKRSRYSVPVDSCATQTYHPFNDIGAPLPPSAPSAGAVSGPKKHHKHDR